MPEIKDRTGIQYGCLTAIKFSHVSNRKSYWFCRCDCGEEVVIIGGNLQSGNTISCGCFQIGRNAGNYIHGESCSIINTKAIKELKEEIRRRDNYTCQDCGLLQKDSYRKLDVHHIDGDETNNVKKNMITLCHDCHLKVRSEDK